MNMQVITVIFIRIYLSVCLLLDIQFTPLTLQR